MRPNEIKNAIKALFQNKLRRAIYLTASPGVGKTEIVGQVASELKIGFKVIHAPLMQPEDYGMPVIFGAKRDQLKFIVSEEKFPLVGSDCEESGILFIDELSQADNSCQKILANLIQSREIHGRYIKEGWTIVCAGNRVQDRSGANPMLRQLANRVTQIPLEVSLDDWSAWALDNEVKPEIVSFIRFRPELLNDFNPQREINATPRAWVQGVSDRMGVIPSDLEFQFFAGDVGEGAAAELMAFLRIFRNLPNPDAVLLNPKKAKVPEDAATRYALVGALVARTTPDNFGRALEYVSRMSPEFTVLYVKDAVSKNSEVTATKEFLAWSCKDGSKLLG
jgi:hypothetical protein